MGLGEHLVRELGYEDSTNTLGRWMAHQLAEDMLLSEEGGSVKIRSAAKKNAKDTILKIWSLRDNLPGEAFPLARYKKLLVMLEAMRPSNNPYEYFGRRSSTTSEDITAKIFDRVSRLVFVVLLLELSELQEKRSARSKVAIDALTQVEKRVLLALEHWTSLFLSDKAETKRRNKEAPAAFERAELLAAGTKFIKEAEKYLLVLREQFTAMGNPKVKTGQPKA